MKVPRANSCCGCWKLKTGVLMIAALEVICSVIVIIASCTSKVELGLVLGDHLEDTEVGKAIILAVFGVQLIVSALLFVGAIKEVSSLMLPWLVLALTGLIMKLLDTLIAMIMNIIDSNPHGVMSNFLTGALVFLIWSYYLIVVYSHYCEVEDEKLKAQRITTNWLPQDECIKENKILSV